MSVPRKAPKHRAYKSPEDCKDERIWDDLRTNSVYARGGALITPQAVLHCINTAAEAWAATWHRSVGRGNVGTYAERVIRDRVKKHLDEQAELIIDAVLGIKRDTYGGRHTAESWLYKHVVELLPSLSGLKEEIIAKIRECKPLTLDEATRIYSEKYLHTFRTSIEDAARKDAARDAEEMFSEILNTREWREALDGLNALRKGRQ